MLAGVYAASSAPLLLLAIGLTHLELLQQLLPFARFDGYFILSDLVGVPDLFARVGPVLRGGPRGGSPAPGAAGLRRRAQALATCWVLCVIPLLALIMGYLLLHLPAANRALWLSASHSAGQAVSRVRHPSVRHGFGQHHRRRAGAAVLRRVAAHHGRAGPQGRRRRAPLVGRAPGAPGAGGAGRGGVRGRADSLLGSAGAVRRLVTVLEGRGHAGAVTTGQQPPHPKASPARGSKESPGKG